MTVGECLCTLQTLYNAALHVLKASELQGVLCERHFCFSSSILCEYFFANWFLEHFQTSYSSYAVNARAYLKGNGVNLREEKLYKPQSVHFDDISALLSAFKGGRNIREFDVTTGSIVTSKFDN